MAYSAASAYQEAPTYSAASTSQEARRRPPRQLLGGVRYSAATTSQEASTDSASSANSLPPRRLRNVRATQGLSFHLNQQTCNGLWSIRCSTHSTWAALRAPVAGNVLSSGIHRQRAAGDI